MTPRRLLFWSHLTVGIVVSLVIVFLATTGCILAFQQQILEFSDRNLHVSERGEGTTCLAPSQILASVRTWKGTEPVSWTSFSDSSKPNEIGLPKGEAVFVDPCNGQIVSGGSPSLHRFFISVRDLHRFVAWGGVRHENLRAVKNAINLGFVFLLCSGLILWFPRKLTLRHARVGLIPRWHGIGRASEWSLHTVMGFWLSVPLVCISLTGAVMGYAWANALLYRVAGSPLPMLRGEREAKAEALPIDQYGQLDTCILNASRQDPEWKSLSLRIPPAKGKDISITLDEGDGRDPRTRSQLVLNRKTGEVIHWDHFQDNKRGRRWRMYARFLHTGELFGLAGQTIAFLSTLGALLLVWTGLSLSLRRFFAWRSRRRRASASAELMQTQASV